MTLDLSHRKHYDLPVEEVKPVSKKADLTLEMTQTLKDALESYLGYNCDWRGVLKEIDLWIKVETIKEKNGIIAEAARTLNLKRTSVVQSLKTAGLLGKVRD